MRKQIATIVSSSIGNILEWYDFGLFTIFSALFGRLFFPAEDARVAMIATFSIFAVGFLCRPIGALIFGYLGDKVGRAKTLRLSILMISLPTLLIGILPTYEQVGILAPILLTLTRIWQGISIGGEFSGNMIYLAENAPSKYRATVTSFASTGANLGILLAAVVGIIISHLISEADLAVWGWRIPYFISGLFSIIIYRFRLNLKESAVFLELKAQHHIAKNPIITLWKHNIPDLLRVIGIVCMGSTYYYFCFVYLPLFLVEEKNLNLQQVSATISVLIFAMLCLVPIGGYICDQIGRRRLMIFIACTIIVYIVPAFYFLHVVNWMVILGLLSSLMLISSLEQATTSITVVENFPPPARYTGLALGYNIGNGLLGGTVPIISQWLQGNTVFPLAPAFYIAFCALVTLITVYFFVPETKGIDLSDMKMRIPKSEIR